MSKHAQKTESSRLLRLAVLTGIIGPFLFAGMLTLLTVLQYDFMRSLGWHPLAPLDWPSGLALGPYGGWMNATFAVGGLALMLLALGLHQLFPASKVWMLFFAAGLAMLMLCFPTDPTHRSTPATFHGILHNSAYVLLGLSFIPGQLMLARQFNQLPERRWYARFTWAAVALTVPSFIIKGLGFYVFLFTILSWYAVTNIQLWQLIPHKTK